MDDEELTTYHEAGHAVMAAFLGGCVDRITIEPENDDQAARYGDTCVVWPGGRWTERELAVHEIKVSLAGPVVEMIYSGNQFAPELLAEWRCDWEMAVARGASFLPSAGTIVAYLERMVSELIQFFERDDVWSAVAAIADELGAHETLGAEEVANVLLAWPIRQ